ncbi:MAG: serine hydrolase domain-containing protein [Rubripirellula sp.]
MQRIIPMLRSLGLLICGLTSATVAAQSPQSKIASYLESQIRSGDVVGASVLVASARSRAAAPTNLGQLSPSDSRPVTDSTLFCVASCSKPVASALVFTLLDRRQLRLDDTVGKYLPALESPRSRDGSALPSPTLRQLLAHRGGIYSQMQRPTPDQLTAIRNFRLSLDESVALIAKQPLLSKPGTAYAYSGAGYCLVGAMAEKATNASIETLLQQNLCTPAGMTSTTYFPTPDQHPEIATGGATKSQPPHLLADELKLPLVGGSLHTTSRDLQRFAKMVLNQGDADGNRVLSQKAWQYYTSQPFQSQPYGFGWLLTKRNGKVVALAHKGSLPPAQAALGIDLDNRIYKVVLWTLSNPSNVQATIRIKETIAKMVR